MSFVLAEQITDTLRAVAVAGGAGALAGMAAGVALWRRSSC